MLLALRQYSDSVGKPLHACAAELIERGLNGMQRHEFNQQQEQQDESDIGQVAPPNGSHLPNGHPETLAEDDKPERPAGQMDLFAG